MNFGDLLVLVLVGFIVAAAIRGASRLVSPRARVERRRRRSNSRIVSRRKRPTVKFSVRTRDHRKD